MDQNRDQRRTADGRPLPGFLRLEFSRAADLSRVRTIFQPETKKHADPDNHVALRREDLVQDHMIHGRAAMITDDDGFVNTLTIAWRLTENRNGKPIHLYTEMGSSISFLPGYGSAQVVIAAAALRDWWLTPPRNKTLAEITKDNPASQKVYRDNLRWKEIRNMAAMKNFDTLSNGTLSSYAFAGSPRSLFHLDSTARQQQARILLDCIANGTLRSKSGHAIPVDMTALQECGLTRARLEALAAGETSRTALRRIAPHI